MQTALYILSIATLNNITHEKKKRMPFEMILLVSPFLIVA